MLPPSFTLFSLTFRSLIHFEFIFVCSVRECSYFILLHSCLVFPMLLIEEAAFSLVYIFASFVVDQVTIGSWVYLWAFYPLIYISGFFFASTILHLMTEALQYSLKSGSLIPPAPFFFLKIALAIAIASLLLEFTVFT